MLILIFNAFFLFAEDMVKKDKVDILDLFLDNGIDIGHFLSEEGQAFGKPRVILDDMTSPFGQADIMIDNTTPPLSQTEIVYNMSTPLAQLDTQQQDMTLNNTIYNGPDFLIDNVSAEVEVPQEITVQVIEGNTFNSLFQFFEDLFFKIILFV